MLTGFKGPKGERVPAMLARPQQAQFEAGPVPTGGDAPPVEKRVPLSISSVYPMPGSPNSGRSAGYGPMNGLADAIMARRRSASPMPDPQPEFTLTNIGGQVGY